jgi:hypothetical protein
MMIVFPLPGGGAAGESKALYTVVKESSSKYSVLLNQGSASAFYKTLNPAWNGAFQYTKGVFSTTSFTTATGTKVIFNTTSKSTLLPSVKIIENGGT